MHMMPTQPWRGDREVRSRMGMSVTSRQGEKNTLNSIYPKANCYKEHCVIAVRGSGKRKGMSEKIRQTEHTNVEYILVGI